MRRRRITRRTVVGGLAATATGPAAAKRLPYGVGGSVPVAAGVLSVSEPTNPRTGQPVTRPNGNLLSINAGFPGGPDFPYAGFHATVNNTSPNANDSLLLYDPANRVLYQNNPVVIGTTTRPITVFVPSIGGQQWNSTYNSGNLGVDGLNPYTTSFVLQLKSGANNSVIASVPVTVDVLKRTNPYFLPIGTFLCTPPYPTDITLRFPDGGVVGGVYAPVVSGTGLQVFAVVGTLLGGVPAAVNTLTLQYTIDGVDIPGAQVTGPPGSPLYQGWTVTLDTTAWTDGTHAISTRVIDYTGGDQPPYRFRPQPFPVIVHNNTSVSLATLYASPQQIPLMDQFVGPKPLESSGIDFVTFPGTSALPLHNTVVSIPSPQSGVILPATSSSSPFFGNAIALRNSANYFVDNLPYSIDNEYTGKGRWFDNTLGGVFAHISYPESSQSLEASQPLMNSCQPFDGGRDDCYVTQIINGIEGYDSSGNAIFWLLSESAGRIIRMNYDGSIQTLAGLTGNRSLVAYPTLELAQGSVTDAQYLSRMSQVGTIGSLGTTSTPSFEDLRGCHDIDYDPRDSTYNTVFVANVLSQTIVKITHLIDGTGAHMVRYAGQGKGLGQSTIPDNGYLGDFQDGVATEFIAGSPVATFQGTVIGNVLTINNGFSGQTNLKGCPLSWSGSSNTNTGHMITTNISGTGNGSQWNVNFSSSGGQQSMTATTQVALFNKPYSLAVADGTGADPAGTIYVADFQNQRLRKISADGTMVTTIFGNQHNAAQGIGWTLFNQSFNINSQMSWSGRRLSVTTSAPAQFTNLPPNGPNFATPHSIAPYWTVQINGTGNGNLDGRYFQVSTVSSSQSFTLAVTNDPGALGSTGTITPDLRDAFLPMVPTYRPWNVGQATEAYFPWVQRMVWSSTNPNAGTSISGGSTKRHLVCSSTWTQSIFEIDLENQQVRTIGALGCAAHSRIQTVTLSPANSQSFVGCDCDATGANGPLNDIMIAQPSASLENYFHRMDWTGDKGPITTWGFQQAEAYSPIRFGINIGIGHYPWMVIFGRKQGRILSSGTSDVGVFQSRILNPAYDVRQDTGFRGSNFTSNTNLDIGAMSRAFSVYCQGTIQAWCNTTIPGMFPWGSRPGLWPLHGYGQHNLLEGLNNYSRGAIVGNNTDSWDALAANLNDAGLTAFIQGGFGGSVPRPELTGDDLKDMRYFIKRSSLQGCLVANVAAFPQREPYEADVTAPVISNNTATRASSTSVTVSWDTDKPTYGFAAAGFASGQGTQFPFHISQLEAWGGSAAASYKTTGHSVTISGLKASVTTYVVIMAKDIPGNNAWSSVMTVT
jgi:hypothetical protein